MSFATERQPRPRWLEERDRADGLYRVEHGDICAGFVMKHGTVIECAPILWRRLPYWLRVAKRIAP